MLTNYLKNRKRTARHVRLIRESVLFDETYYVGRYGLPKTIDAALYYYRKGWMEGHNPSIFFDTEFYLNTYDDVRSVQLNPLVHYLTGGAKEFRRPIPEFDVDLFRKEHPDQDFGAVNIAEFCISNYGRYPQQDGVHRASRLSDDVIEAFKNYFDPDFYRSTNSDLAALTDPYAHFLLEGQYQGRDPSPTFDIHYYGKKISKNKFPFSNPIFHYVREGRVQNFRTQPENSTILELAPDRHRNQLPTLCVHAHCFYPELLGELIAGFSNLPRNAHIVVTVVTAADLIFAKQKLSLFDLSQSIEVRLVRNRGRDLGPFLISCYDVWKHFEVVLHIHTKVSPHVSWGSHWRRYLLEQTLGSVNLITAALCRFRDEPSLACLYPRNFYKIRPDADKEINAPAIDALLQRFGVAHDGQFDRGFPAGSMAWYRTSAIIPLAQNLRDIEEFEEENGQIDSTLAHALERALPYFVRAAGLRAIEYTTYGRASLRLVAGFPERESSRSDVSRRWQANTPQIAQRQPQALAPLSKAYNAIGLHIHWILPSFARGAGGHMTIFRMVEYLERFGHYQTLWIQDAVQFADQAEAVSRIRQWYRPVGRRVHLRFLPNDVRELSGDILIATDVWTMFPASQATNFKERFQFVQDDEVSFFPAGEQRLLAETTHTFGFAALCAGDWLLELANRRGTWSRSWELCADKEVYYKGVPKLSEDRVLRIAFYARPYTPRRATKLGFAAFDLLNRRGVKFHVELFGEADLKVEFSFPNTQHGVLSPDQLGELYRNSDIGVVFSATNYSLVPLEMMACGLPVVELDTPSTRAIFKNNEVLFAQPTPYGVADAVEYLIDHADQRIGQVNRASSFVDTISWERSARAVESALLERLSELGFLSIENLNVSNPAPQQNEIHAANIISRSRVSIVIPTRNAGPGFANVMNQVVAQKCDFKYDVLIIDSTSDDETTEIASRYTRHGVRVERIAQEHFQHGRTRNVGIAHTDGDFVAFLTQDALPCSATWLQTLVAGFKQGKRVAGVIGRHAAYPEHDAFTRRDLEEMFDAMRALPEVLSYEIGLPSYLYPGSRSWRMLMHFYSDNNSAISREAWKILPYPEIDWGEDQVWADEALRLGFEKVYVDAAVVYHSHRFDYNKQFDISKIEGEFWGKYFGIDLHPNHQTEVKSMNDRDTIFALTNGIDRLVLKQRLLYNRSVVEGRKAGYELSLPSSTELFGC